MSTTFDAVYEDGVLKPNVPLPLSEHEKVRVTIQPNVSIAQQTSGILEWSGDAETLRQVAEDSEFGISESP